MSLIISSFSSNPTRQQIVDLLFEVLPENIRLEEAEVKKYFKAPQIWHPHPLVPTVTSQRLDNRRNMESNGLQPETAQYYLSTTSLHHRDYQMRKRAASCSSLSSGAMAGPATVYFPASPHSLSQASHLLTFPSIQRPSGHKGFIGNQNNDGYGSMGGPGSTQDGGTDIESPVSLTPGAFSALGIEPGPASFYPYAGMSRFQTAPTPPWWADNPSSPSPPLLGHPPMGPTLTVTRAPSDGLTAADPAFSKNLAPLSANPHYSMSSSQCTSPSSPNWPAGQLGAPDLNLLCPQHGSWTPSSLSALSSPSASPLSGFSTLSINSPPSSIGEVDDDGSSRVGQQPEGQVQRDRYWGADGWVHEQASLFPRSPPCLDNGIESFASRSSLTALSTTPGSTTADRASDASSNGDPGPSENVRSIPDQNHYPPRGQSFGIEGIETFPGNSQPDPASPPFPPAPYTIFEGYRSGDKDFGMASHIHPGSPSGIAGPSFSSQVDESYEGIPGGYYYPPPHSAIATSSVPSTAPICGAIRGVYLHRQSGASSASARKKGAWSDEASRAKKVVKQTNNELLHASITSLEHKGLIPQMSSLRDTVRFIIGRCFEDSPTRQNIVDLLFGALPEEVQKAVVEVDVKKYYKDRIGHILSAPANRNIFANISGTGRWVLAEPFE
ncbi:hypothetical protein FRC01_003019 [Tulasnella sp. 417]|nr:hypothetical protein FRC01_003019 [Tulasnella sp. 417]